MRHRSWGRWRGGPWITVIFAPRNAAEFARVTAEQFAQQASRNGNHLHLRMDGGNSLVLQDLFDTDKAIEHIAFADGSHIDAAGLYAQYGDKYQGNSGGYDAARVLEEYGKISGII